MNGEPVMYQFQRDITVDGKNARGGDIWFESDFPSGTLESCRRIGHVAEYTEPPTPEPVKAPEVDPESIVNDSGDDKTPVADPADSSSLDLLGDL